MRCVRVEMVVPVLLGLLLGNDATAQSPAAQPDAPEFRGWYTRISDADGLRSLAVIGATQRLAGTEPGRQGTLPGYLAVIWSEGDGAPTRVVEAFPERTAWVTFPTRLWKRRATGPGFAWYAPGFGLITHDGIWISIPGAVRVRARVRGRLPWDSQDLEVGPEGAIQNFPLPLHWFVYNLGSPARYRVHFAKGVGRRRRERTLHGRGSAHQESNWGTAFPESWVWAQGIGEGGDAQLALSGGPVDFGPVVSEGWLLGYRSPDLSWSFSPLTRGLRIEREIDACAGTLWLTAIDRRRRLEISASAPVDSFVELSVPTREGYEPSADESFSATLEVLATSPIADGGEEHLERRLFSNAALEFGGGFRCQP